MVPRRPPRPATDPVPDLQPPDVESIETATGLAWSAMCCTVRHGSITGTNRYTLIYIIIIERLY